MSNALTIKSGGGLTVKSAGSLTIKNSGIATTELLMPLDTVVEDVSANPMSFTVEGGAAISSDQYRFGGASLSLDGNPSTVVSAPLNSKWSWGLNAFCIEGWFYLNANDIGYQPLICGASDGDFQGPVLILEATNTLTLYCSGSGTWWDYGAQTSFVPTANEWHHIAVVRQSEGGGLRLYCDGVLIGQDDGAVIGNALFTSSNLLIGHYPYFPGGPLTLNGYVDELRITVGSPVYTGPFTPPNAPFPV